MSGHFRSVAFTVAILFSLIGCSAPHDRNQNPIGMVTMSDAQIKPSKIEHNIDVIEFDGKVEQYYNFINYHFESGNSYIYARTYLDEINTVNVFGPFDHKSTMNKIQDEEHFQKVLEYLKLRFFSIQIMGKDGQKQIWPNDPSDITSIYGDYYIIEE